MLITILYSLWIAYTVGSLSVFGLLAILSIFARIDEKKRKKKLDELFSLNKTELKEEGW